jgi:glycosyltransferase EpsE
MSSNISANIKELHLVAQEFDSRPSKVSVVMATFNDDSELLNLSLKSIVEQSYPHWELIVVDDSTSQNTINVLKHYASRYPVRIQLRHNDKRQGFVRSLNLGISYATGDYIARMDGDDISLPNRLEVQTIYLNRNPEVGIVGTDILIIDKVGALQSSRVYPHTTAQVKAWAYFRNPIAHPTVMIRREIFSRIGGYDQNFKRAEDYELWLRALRAGVTINNIDKILLHYRIVGTYAAKRDKANWGYVLRAKLKHFNYRKPARAIAGIIASALFYALPPFLMNIIFTRDTRGATS